MEIISGNHEYKIARMRKRIRIESLRWHPERQVYLQAFHIVGTGTPSFKRFERVLGAGKII